MAHSSASAPHRPRIEAALVVIAAGVCAALHIGKLPPAIPALQQALGLSLVEAGFLLSLVQLAGMSLGLAFGAAADGLGARRSLLLGLLLLAAASLLGGAAGSVAVLMVLRAVEGFGFLLVVLPGPGLVRRLVAPARVDAMLGMWGTYMPLATALALLSGPLLIGAAGWRAWWWALAALTLAMAAWVRVAVPADPARPPAGSAAPWLQRVRQTLAAPGPWMVALAFAAYSSQWLSVIGFLPVIVTQTGAGMAAVGALTALVAAVNMVGNVAAGRLLQRGVSPIHLLGVGYSAMALCALAAFAGGADLQGGLPPSWRYAALLAFSMLGGLVPSTLFSLAVRVAPGEQTISTTVGWMQQWSSIGQFAGPPAVAWLASRMGGWHWTWAVTGLGAAVGLGLALALSRLRPR